MTCFRTRRRYLIPPLVAVAVFAAACEERAETFFSGRPSQMAMVHNRIIAGPPEAMLELLQVPSRFPDASETHIASWQESVTAWWRHPEKHDLMVVSLRKMSREEIHAFTNWVRVRGTSQSRERAQVLEEIEASAARS